MLCVASSVLTLNQTLDGVHLSLRDHATMQLWVLLWGQEGFLEEECLDKGEGKD